MKNSILGVAAIHQSNSSIGFYLTRCLLFNKAEGLLTEVACISDYIDSESNRLERKRLIKDIALLGFT